MAFPRSCLPSCCKVLPAPLDCTCWASCWPSLSLKGNLCSKQMRDASPIHQLDGMGALQHTEIRWSKYSSKTWPPPFWSSYSYWFLPHALHFFHSRTLGYCCVPGDERGTRAVSSQGTSLSPLHTFVLDIFCLQCCPESFWVSLICSISECSEASG